MKKLTISIVAAVSLTLCTPLNANAVDPTFYTPVPMEVSGSSQLNYPSSMATAPNGDVWWADWDHDQVYLFDKDAIAGSEPKKTITLRPNSDTNADASSIAVDSSGLVYVVDATLHPTTGKIYVFDPSEKNNMTFSDVKRTITHPREVRGIAVDAEGKIYIAGSTALGNKLEIRVFAADASDSTSSEHMRRIVDENASTEADSYGIAISAIGEIILSNQATHSIRIYNTSNTTGIPDRIISGANSRLTGSCYQGALKLDSEGRIYLVKGWCADSEILIFDANANGNSVAPIAVIKGAGLQDLTTAFTLSTNSSIWLGFAAQIKKISNPFTLADYSPVSTTIDPVQAAKEAAEIRTRAVESAKTEIRSVLSSGKPLTADQLQKADIPGVTAKNVDSINADLAKLPEDKRGDIAEVVKVVFKFATVDKIANQERVVSSDLISVGLVKPESKVVTSIMIELKRLPASSLDTFEKIQAAVAAVEKKYADRKARLAAVLSR